MTLGLTPQWIDKIYIIVNNPTRRNSSLSLTVTDRFLEPLFSSKVRHFTRYSLRYVLWQFKRTLDACDIYQLERRPPHGQPSFRSRTPQRFYKSRRPCNKTTWGYST